MLFQGHRSTDAVITICQDNAARSVMIKELNRPAEEILGYENNSVSGKDLEDFLPQRIQTLLHEYVEFEEYGNDVGNVLSRVQSFCVIDARGREIAFRLKVLRSESLDRNDYFKLILQDKSGAKKEDAFRSMLRENLKGHEVLDPATGMPDRSSIAKDLELVMFYVKKEAFRACFAVLEIDEYPELKKKHGEAAISAMFRHVAHLTKQNLRPDDTIGVVGPGTIGIILMDTNMESARLVLNRLRWLIAAHPYTIENKETLPVTVSIAYARIGSPASEKDLLPKVEDLLNMQPDHNGNALIEMPE